MEPVTAVSSVPPSTVGAFPSKNHPRTPAHTAVGYGSGDDAGNDAQAPAVDATGRADNRRGSSRSPFAAPAAAAAAAAAVATAAAEPSGEQAELSSGATCNRPGGPSLLYSRSLFGGGAGHDHHLLLHHHHPTTGHLPTIGQRIGLPISSSTLTTGQSLLRWGHLGAACQQQQQQHHHHQRHHHTFDRNQDLPRRAPQQPQQSQEHRPGQNLHIQSALGRQSAAGGGGVGAASAAAVDTQASARAGAARVGGEGSGHEGGDARLLHDTATPLVNGISTFHRTPPGGHRRDDAAGNDEDTPTGGSMSAANGGGGDGGGGDEEYYPAAQQQQQQRHYHRRRHHYHNHGYYQHGHHGHHGHHSHHRSPQPRPGPGTTNADARVPAAHRVAAQSLLSSWLSLARTKVSKRQSTKRQLRMSWYRSEEDTGKECCICLDDICLNDKVTRLPCQHMFHHSCIVEWVQKKKNCPQCRGDAKSPAGPLPPPRTARRSPRARHDTSATAAAARAGTISESKSSPALL